MNKTIIETATGLVVNVIVLADGSSWTPSEGQSIGPDGGQLGLKWNGSAYVPVDQPQS